MYTLPSKSFRTVPSPKIEVFSRLLEASRISFSLAIFDLMVYPNCLHNIHKARPVYAPLLRNTSDSSLFGNQCSVTVEILS